MPLAQSSMLSATFHGHSRKYVYGSIISLLKPLSPRIVFFFTSRSLSINSINNGEFYYHSHRISHLSTSSNPFHPSSSSSFQARRQDEESRNVRVLVWWNLENCALPAGANVFRVGQSITAAIRANGIKGPIQVTAFGDVLQLSRTNQEALTLSATGINLTHIPHGGKNSIDRSLCVDLMCWVSQNPPPAHLFVISGDGGLASTLHRLRMSNYNILLGSPEIAPSALCSAASIMWQWNALVKGENLTGRYFNQPPHDSWYGHYRVPLEDPFAVPEQPACSRAEEVSESNSDLKIRPVPKAVVKQVRHILKSYPKEVSITELSSKLRKGNVSIDKDLYVGKDVSSENKSFDILEKGTTCGESTEKSKSEEKCRKSTCQSTDPVGAATVYSSSNEGGTDDKVVGCGQAYTDKSSSDPSLFKKIISWCKFWRKGPDSENLCEQASEKVNQVIVDSGKHEVFFKESFWKEMEAFINTPHNGSVLILQSRSREQLAQNLQKQGPLVLRSVSQNDLLHLVDLLISEKRWIEECPSQTYPFKLIQPVGKSSTFSTPNSNGLRSLFSSTSQYNSQRLPEYEREIRHQDLAHSRVSPPVTKKKLGDKSRNEILSDCQKLVDDIVKEHPEGFNMGSFRKLFLDSFGYPLDIQKLGYHKLATLLQIMPGVKIESTFILPCSNVAKSSHLETALPSVVERNLSSAIANSDSDLSNESTKDDDLESPWEELGPVADKGLKRNERNLGSKGGVNEETVRQIHHDYETLSDYISDSEEDTSSLKGSGQGKPRINDEDSSLLRILDSWYSTEKETDRKEGSENVDGKVDCSENVLKPSASFEPGIKTDTPVVNCGWKQRPFKSYSFVSEQLGNNKDNLIDGILSSLKKSGESRTVG